MTANNRTAVIEDPAAYLKNKYHISDAKLLRSASIDENRVPAYLIEDYNACAVNAAACIAAFASGKEGSFGRSLEICKAIARSGFSKAEGSTVNYYTRLGTEAPFVRRCLDASGSGYTARSSLFVKKRAVREILAGRPVLLNIGISGQYRDHTVTAYGFEEYSAGERGKKYLFFKVRDGYSKDERYVLYRGILGISITYLKQKH